MAPAWLQPLVISPTWMVECGVVSGELYETKTDDEGHLVSSTIYKHMLPLYRKMLYERCISTEQPSSKVEEIHNWFLKNTGVGL